MGIEVLDCVKEILDRVAQETGKEVKLIINENQKSMVEVKTARKRDDFHYIFCSKNYTGEINYLIACKAIQIIRIYKVPEEKREMAVTYQEHINSARMDMAVEINKKPHLEVALNDPQLTSTWVLSLINQLISQPVNINLDKIIYKEYPELREYQLNVVENQFKDFNATLTRELEKISPALIYNNSAIMNYVYLKSIDEITGSDFIGRLNFSVKRIKSEKLYNYTTDHLGTCYTSDIKIIKYWAKFLNVESWFTWDNFESVADE